MIKNKKRVATGVLFVLAMAFQANAFAVMPPPVVAAPPVPAAPAEFSLFEEIPMVTSASRIEESILEAPAAISVISAKDLHDWGTVELPDAFRYTPGIDVTAYSERDFGVTARGFNERRARRMLVLVDNMSVYFPIDSGVLWQNLALVNEDIDQIEIIRGSNDTLYGFNAFNGVINIKTKEAKDSKGFYSKYIWGSDHRNKLVSRYGQSLDLWGYNMDFKISYSADDSQGYGSLHGKEYQDWRRLNLVHAKSKLEFSDKLNLESILGMNYGPFGRHPFSTTNGSPQFYSNERFDFQEERLNMEFTDTNKAFLQFYRWNFFADGNTISGSRGFGGSATEPFRATRDTTETEYDMEFEHQFSLWEGKSQTVWGGNVRYHEAQTLSATSPGAYRETTTDNLHSYYINEKLTLLQDLSWAHKVSVVAGVRGEASGFLGDTKFAPRASILYEPTKDHVFRGTYARGFRLPSFTEERGTVFVPSNTGNIFRLIGDRNLTSEIADQVELGYSGNWLDNKLTLDADTYVTRYVDLVRAQEIQSFNPFPTSPSIAEFSNDLSALAYGVELSQKYKVSTALEVYSNMTLQEINDDWAANSGAPFRDGSPKTKIAFGFNLKFNKDTIPNLPILDGVMLNVNMNYRGKYNIYTIEDSPVTKTPIEETFQTDLNVSKKLFSGDAELAFTVQNLTGEGRFETQFVRIPRLYYVTFSMYDWPWAIVKKDPLSSGS